MLAVRLIVLTTLTLLLNPSTRAQLQPTNKLAADGVQFRSLMRNSPHLAFRLTELTVEPPGREWKMEMVSSVAAYHEGGLIYVLQRGSQADPVIALDRQGRILRSWGRGLYKIPHSIRVDRHGQVWTVDAGNSRVLKFSPDGKQLLEISVGGLPVRPKSEFCGATDIAFGPGDRVLISDGYANARIIEYSGDGKRLREWGSLGEGPGQFRVPHAIVIDRDEVIYVADRENGRIQRFSLDGRYIGEWRHLGKTFSLQVTPTRELWLGTQPSDVANGVEPWLVKIDARTGVVLGTIESHGHHSIDLTAEGEPLTGARPDRVLWFRSTGP
jgi:DNA-binding beta-propeller fold protein YncE